MTRKKALKALNWTDEQLEAMSIYTDELIEQAQVATEAAQPKTTSVRIGQTRFVLVDPGSLWNALNKEVIR